MKLRSLADLFKKACKRLAWWASTILQPLIIYRWTGILVYHTISYREFFSISFRPDAQDAMDEKKPRSIHDKQIWTFTPASDLVMSHVLTIEEGIADRLGNIFDPKTGKLISGATHKYRYKVKRAHIPRSHQRYPHIERLSGDVAVFTASNQHIYWHWLLDVIPRVIMLEDLRKMPKQIYLQNRLRFQKETLTLMGIAPRVVEIDCDQFPMISASTLLVPCHQIMEGRNFPQWVCETLRNTFLAKAVRRKDITTDRIYISRAAANQRRVLNEEEITPLLQRYGFHIVKLEELSFREQVGIFRDADVVLAANGSGLANLVFCSEGTRVIEFFPCSDQALTSTNLNFNFDYNYRLSRERNLDYYYLSCPACKKRGSDPKIGDFKIVEEDLREVLDLARIVP